MENYIVKPNFGQPMLQTDMVVEWVFHFQLFTISMVVREAKRHFDFFLRRKWEAKSMRAPS